MTGPTDYITALLDRNTHLHTDRQGFTGENTMPSTHVGKWYYEPGGQQAPVGLSAETVVWLWTELHLNTDVRKVPLSVSNTLHYITSYHEMIMTFSWGPSCSQHSIITCNLKHYQYHIQYLLKYVTLGIWTCFFHKDFFFMKKVLKCHRQRTKPDSWCCYGLKLKQSLHQSISQTVNQCAPIDIHSI